MNRCVCVHHSLYWREKNLVLRWKKIPPFTPSFLLTFPSLVREILNLVSFPGFLLLSSSGRYFKNKFSELEIKENLERWRKEKGKKAEGKRKIRTEIAGSSYCQGKERHYTGIINKNRQSELRMRKKKKQEVFQLHSICMRENFSGQSINSDTFVLELDRNFELKEGERPKEERERNQKKRERERSKEGNERETGERNWKERVDNIYFMVITKAIFYVILVLLQYIYPCFNTTSIMPLESNWIDIHELSLSITFQSLSILFPEVFPSKNVSLNDNLSLPLSFSLPPTDQSMHMVNNPIHFRSYSDSSFGCFSTLKSMCFRWVFGWKTKGWSWRTREKRQLDERLMMVEFKFHPFQFRTSKGGKTFRKSWLNTMKCSESSQSYNWKLSSLVVDRSKLS